MGGEQRGEKLLRYDTRSDPFRHPDQRTFLVEISQSPSKGLISRGIWSEGLTTNPLYCRRLCTFHSSLLYHIYPVRYFVQSGHRFFSPVQRLVRQDTWDVQIMPSGPSFFVSLTKRILAESHFTQSQPVNFPMCPLDIKMSSAIMGEDVRTPSK